MQVDCNERETKKTKDSRKWKKKAQTSESAMERNEWVTTIFHFFSGVDVAGAAVEMADAVAVAAADALVAVSLFALVSFFFLFLLLFLLVLVIFVFFIFFV
jgi:hypothetical protein